MNVNKKIQRLRSQVLTVTALTLLASPSLAVNLVAIEGQWSPEGSTTQIPMWGFALDVGQDCAPPPDWSVGPQLNGGHLTDEDADTQVDDLVINLRNCLSEGVSIIIPGQPATFTPVTTLDLQGRTRVTAFTAEAAANGGTHSYTWSNVKAGTYLYQSGSHPAKQVQMGLYGALTLGTYTGTSTDVTLLYSEIDPALHSPPAAATPLEYKPKHYLVNGADNHPMLVAGDTNQPTVLRFLNAGLDFHVPALNGGYMSLVAEDGNAYPVPREQYSVNLAAGKTIDALWQPAAAGDHVLYDRRGNGMLASLTVAAGVGAPVAVEDHYTTDEDVLLNVAAPGVLDNDEPSTSAVLVSVPANGTLDQSLAADGSFIYTPNADFSGSDIFTYLASDGVLDSNVVSVTITVNPINDPPAAAADVYDAVEAETLNVAAPGVLGNDIDADGDSLSVTVTPVTMPTNGALTLSADGAFAYTPFSAAPDNDSFSYELCDASLLCDTATVSINIISQPNSAPLAADDSATVFRNSLGTFIDLTNNDSDADGNLTNLAGVVPAGQISITTGVTTSRGGSVTVLDDGVTYIPKRNFRGTDTFNYTVSDTLGAVSNEATVRVNVIRP